MSSTVAAFALPAAGLAGLGAALTARRWPLVVPLLLVAIGLVLAIASLVDTRDLHRTGPLGYANASAAVCVAAGAAALQLHLGARTVRLRRATLAVMLALLTMPLWFRSRAAAAGALIVLAGLSPAVRRLGARTVASMGAVLVLVTVLATVGLALLWQQGPGATGRLLSERLVGVRAEIWLGALEQWRADPIRGGGELGAGTTGGSGFRRFAHSAFLHVGAVTGSLGVIALVLVAGLLVVALGRADTQATLVAGLALTALGVQASVDYVGHFVVVLAVFGGLVGSALTTCDPPRSGQP
ncbi:MAG TPA: hypothetical protein VK906_00925 [Egicoccus sp.]|nr:hypothetical protein [Egicoccus sp.]